MSFDHKCFPCFRVVQHILYSGLLSGSVGLSSSPPGQHDSPTNTNNKHGLLNDKLVDKLSRDAPDKHSAPEGAGAVAGGGIYHSGDDGGGDSQMMGIEAEDTDHQVGATADAAARKVDRTDDDAAKPRVNMVMEGGRLQFQCSVKQSKENM